MDSNSSHGTNDDPHRLTWAYYDNLCTFAEQQGTRHNEDTAAHLERLRVKVAVVVGERPATA